MSETEITDDEYIERQTQEIARLTAERDALKAEVERLREDWAREFELRGELAATVERRIAEASQRSRLPEELVERAKTLVESYHIYAAAEVELLVDILAAVERDQGGEK